MFHRWYSDVQESQIAPSSAFALAVVLAAVHVVDASHLLPVEDDPLVRMPGTQPQRVTLDAPYLCPNRHADYNSQVEPGFN